MAQFYKKKRSRLSQASYLRILKRKEFSQIIVGQATKELRILGLSKGAEIGAAVAIELEGIPYVPIHDPYGNVATLLNLNGEVTTSYRYTAFGEEEIKGESQNAWRYSSKRVDPETGYIYFGRRYYMLSIGRWLTPDPLWFADGPNLYAYLHNRPLTSIDPDGQFAFLIPIVLSLALDYCMPTIVAGLTECALGGGLLASALSGFVSGYNDPFSSAFDPDTYSIGDADWTNFACNRACMLLGAAVACKPTNAAKNGFKSVVNVASREIAGTVIAKTEVALTKAITNGVKQGGRTAAQKTASVAERNIIKNEINPLKGTSYTTKVLDQMRCNARTSLPDFHGFPRIVDNYASLDSKELIVGKNGIGRIKILLPGCYRGKEGYFEWIVENNNTINHRLFIPNP